MSEHKIDVMWDDAPVDVSTEVNFIWSIANKLRGTYQSDKYKDVIIPMVIIRRFECALEGTKQAVVEQYKKNPAYPAKAMCRVSGYQFFNTSEYTLAELVNDPDHLAANFRNYIEGFSANVQDIIKSLDFDKQIDKMDKNNRLLSVVKAFSELDLDPKTIDNVKMGYIFEDLIRRFSENAEAGDHYTGRDPARVRESWNQAFGGSANANKVAVLEEGMHFTPISIAPDQAQFLETRKFQLNEIARIFRVPPHMIGDLERATFSNIEHLSLEFVKYSLDPWLVRWEQSMSRVLFTDDEKREYFIKFNVDGLLRGDYQSRMSGYSVGIQNGFLSPNDVRELENMDLIPDELGGNRYLCNGNMIDIGSAARSYVE